MPYLPSWSYSSFSFSAYTPLIPAHTLVVESAPFFFFFPNLFHVVRLSGLVLSLILSDLLQHLVDEDKWETTEKKMRQLGWVLLEIVLADFSDGILFNTR